MIHRATPEYWARYHALPREVQELASRAFATLKSNPRHNSLHLKKAGKFWSARVGIGYRAVGVDIAGGILWFFIGTHSEYDKLLD